MPSHGLELAATEGGCDLFVLPLEKELTSSAEETRGANVKI